MGWSKQQILIRSFSNQSTNHRRKRDSSQWRALYTHNTHTHTHTHTSKTIYSLAACLSFSLDNMVDQNKVEISEAKATELEKKVLTQTNTRLSLEEWHGFKLNHCLLKYIEWPSNIDQHQQIYCSKHTHTHSMQPLLPDAPRCLSAPVSWQMCNLGGEMSRTEISCLFLTSSLQTHQTQSTITVCVCVCVLACLCAFIWMHVLLCMYVSCVGFSNKHLGHISLPTQENTAYY